MHKNLEFYVLFFAHLLYFKVLYLFYLIILSYFDFILFFLRFPFVNVMFSIVKLNYINRII